MRPQELTEYAPAEEVPTIIRELSYNQIVCGHGDTIIPRDRWESMKISADAFYATHSDDWIALYNLSRKLDELEEDWRPRRQDKPEQDRKGFVYVVRVAGRLIKIGRTGNLSLRVRGFQTALPDGCELLHSAYVKDCADLERRLHEHFAERRINGEWFDLNPKDIQEVCMLQDELQRPYTPSR